MVKKLPITQETWVQSLGQEDPLEKGMTTHSNILAWRIPWMEEPGGPESTGVTKSDSTGPVNTAHCQSIWGCRLKYNEGKKPTKGVLNRPY